jgi:hypothetical protein
MMNRVIIGYAACPGARHDAAGKQLFIAGATSDAAAQLSPRRN